jgi:hypothetical protein
MPLWKRSLVQNAAVLDGLKIFRGKLAVAIILDGIEAELLAFVERRQAGTLNGRNVHEHIRVAVVRLNETEALGHIEEFNGTNGHGDLPFDRSKNLARPISHDGLFMIDFKKGRS